MLNLGSTPEGIILRVSLSALVVNFPLVGEREDTGCVSFRATFPRVELISRGPALLAVPPLLVDDLPTGGDLSGAPGQDRVGLGAALVGDAFVAEGEDAAVALESPAL